MKEIFTIKKKNIAAFLICIVIGIAFASFATHADDGIISYQKGRDPIHHSLDLHTFLTNGSGIGFEKFLGFFFEIPHENFTVYIGWLPLLFLIYAILNVRIPTFIGITICAVFLSLFSAGDSFPLAKYIYQFILPMKWFQYIGQIASLARIFFILAAGFGIEHFFQDPNSHNRKSILSISIALVVSFFCLSKFCSNSIPWQTLALKAFYIAAFIIFIVALSIMVRSHSLTKMTLMGIVVFLLLDFVPYHFALASAWQHPAVIQNSATDVVYQDQFQPTRILSEEFQNDPRRVMVDQNPIERLAIDALNFIQADPCFELYPSLLVPENVWHYLEIRSDYKRTKDQEGFRSEWKNSVPLFYEIGCHTAKLRLVDQSLIAKTNVMQDQLVRSNLDLGKIVVLDTDTTAINPKPSEQNRLGSVQVTSYSYNHIDAIIDVLNPEGAWLYYADSYHPDWKATVNNASVLIYPANIAFKAIRVPQGKSRISFSFNHGKANIFAHFIAIIGFVFVIAATVMGIGQLKRF